MYADLCIFTVMNADTYVTRVYLCQR